jgi:TolB-like protein/tetratricopeptide (TPR) repeat protein
MASIFLSYAREDRRFVEKLVRVLEDAGHEVWWDRHIESGREFAAEIEIELEKADLVLVAWSKTAARSPWVRDEAAIGRDRGRLLPVLVDGSQPPIGFRQVQALDLCGWKGRRRDQRSKALIDAIEKVVSDRAPAAAQPKSRSVWRKANPLWAIAAALALVIAAGIELYLVKTGSSAAEPASVAVLPFKNLSSGDPYFAEGVAEEVANELAREPQFKVAGRTSSALFKDAADLRDVGRRLHVAYVLEGSVRSTGQQVRVNVSLVDAHRGMRLWSQNFRGSLNDIFAIQDTIGEQVAAHVKRQLIAQPAPRGTTTTRGDVYSLYLTARGLIRSREPAKLHSASDLLRQAIRLDPGYAPAWAQLAQALRFEWQMSQPGEAGLDAARQQWLQIAQHAVRLAPDSADAHLAMCYVLSSFVGEDPKYNRVMEAHCDRAAQLDPNGAEVWDSIAQGYEEAGDFPRALDAYRRLYSIEPLWWHGYGRLTDLSWRMGFRDEARRVVDQTVRDAKPFSGDMVRTTLAIQQGDWSEALRWLRAARSAAEPSEKVLTDIRTAMVMRSLGYFEEAKARFPLYEVDEDMWLMWNGKAPSPPRVAELGRSPVRLWAGAKAHFLIRTLVRERRSAELVRLYDLRFKSPDELYATLDGIPAELIMALRDVGRNADADRMTRLAEADLQDVQSHGRVPFEFWYWRSQFLAATGKPEEATAALQKAVDLGWFYNNETSSFGDIAEEPAFRDIVSDRRFQRIRAYLARHVARERQEVVTGLQAS